METLRRGDLVFDVVDAGPRDGEVVVLFHGFPQNPAMWDGVAPLLHAAGYRTVAMAQRGYSPGARPPRRRDYRLTELAADAAALVDAIDAGPVHVVGHDWGSEVAWMLAAWYPAKVRTLTIFSGPHLAAFLRSALVSLQGLSSWYMGMFQIPGLERAFDPASPAGRRRFMRLMRYFRQADPTAARDTDFLGSAAGMRGALNWYRALPFLPWKRLFTASTVRAPTLQVWSDGDNAIRRKGAELSARYVTGPYRFEPVTGITHWIPEEAPQLTADFILGHVAEDRPVGSAA